MNTNFIEIAIQKAVEGGLNEHKGHDFNKVRWIGGNTGTVIDLVNVYPGGESFICTSAEELLLNPKMWQALAKTEGWVDDNEIEWVIPSTMTYQQGLIEVEDRLGVPIRHIENRIIYRAYSNGTKTPREQQHRLIDAIQQGRSINEFFGEILKK